MDEADVGEVKEGGGSEEQGDAQQTRRYWQKGLGPAARVCTPRKPPEQESEAKKQDEGGVTELSFNAVRVLRTGCSVSCQGPTSHQVTLE